MPVEKQISKTIVKLEKGDITDFEVEAIVYYAREDLKLGSGFGNAIALRGGPSIQKELDQLGPAQVTEVFMTGAGKMKTKHILHAVGPKFQEERLSEKLAQTVENVLRKAAEKGLHQVAFPAMGAGFYGVPLTTCAEVMLETFKQCLEKTPGINEIIIKALDSREYKPFCERIEEMS